MAQKQLSLEKDLFLGVQKVLCLPLFQGFASVQRSQEADQRYSGSCNEVGFFGFGRAWGDALPHIYGHRKRTRWICHPVITLSPTRFIPNVLVSGKEILKDDKVLDGVKKRNVALPKYIWDDLYGA